MKVTTKTGDRGQTKFRGMMLDKDGPIFELLGGLDEVQAAIGVAYEFDELHHVYLYDVMKDIYKIMGAIYTQENIDVFLEQEIAIMEFTIRQITEQQEEKFNRFVLPIGSKYIAQLNYARTVVRRIERLFVAHENFTESYYEMLKFLNRLSDFLYTLATSLQD
jgi:cob(I)alamin adenosyltransferase